MISKRKKERMKNEYLNKFVSDPSLKELNIKNLYILDYKNKFLKKHMKYSNMFKSVISGFYFDFSLTFVIVGINYLIADEKYKTVQEPPIYISTMFCFICWLIFVIIDTYIASKKNDVISEVENSIIIKKDKSIAIVKQKETPNALPPSSALSAIGLMNSDNIFSSLVYMNIIAHNQERITNKEFAEYKNSITEKIDKILSNKTSNYLYKTYTNCELIKETKNYYLYYGDHLSIKNGDTINKREKFKIYKVYLSADEVLNGGKNNV